MAFYDNKHWLLLHIRNSFISSDDTGLCEMVMVGEDIHRNLNTQSKFDCYPGVDESDDEDSGPSDSFDFHLDLGMHRQRSNTAQRLEKMDKERKRAAKIKHVKWEPPPTTLTSEEMAQLFARKEVPQKSPEGKKVISVLSQQLQQAATLINENPFKEYSKFDGVSLNGQGTKTYAVFMMMLPEERRSYPFYVTVVATAKIQDLIGFICWKYTYEHPGFKFKEDLDSYGLYIAERDGEVDWDFPCLDRNEPAGKFDFSFVALTELTDSSRLMEDKMHESWPIFKKRSPEQEDEPTAKARSQQQEAEDLQRMKGHMTAMEAPLYQSYRVYILHKMKAKTEIHLGVSGEKLEVDPVIQQKTSARFWSRQKAVSYDMDTVAACDLTDKSSSHATFKLVYQYTGEQGQTGFKHREFETDLHTAEEIVQKINHILELRSSSVRKEYLAFRERKAHRRRSFHLGPR